MNSIPLFLPGECPLSTNTNTSSQMWTFWGKGKAGCAVCPRGYWESGVVVQLHGSGLLLIEPTLYVYRTGVWLSRV